MSNYKLRWQEKQARQKNCGPWLRLDRAWLEKDKNEYTLTIIGFGFEIGPVPPIVTIGEEQVKSIQLSSDRRKLKGRMDRFPKSNEVLVNLGPGLQGTITLEK